jgi:hypothetical protein
VSVTSFADAAKTTIRDAGKLKAKMVSKGLTAARVRCPECPGKIHGRLRGRKNHLSFWCDGPCGRRMME